MNPRDPNAVDSRRRGEKHVDERLMKNREIIHVDYDAPAIAEELHTLAGTWPKIVEIDDATFWPIVERHKLPPVDEAEVQKTIDRFLGSPGTLEQKARYLENRFSRQVRYRVAQALSEHMAAVIQQRRRELEERAAKAADSSPQAVLARRLGLNH